MGQEKIEHVSLVVQAVQMEKDSLATSPGLGLAALREKEFPASRAGDSCQVATVIRKQQQGLGSRCCSCASAMLQCNSLVAHANCQHQLGPCARVGCLLQCKAAMIGCPLVLPAFDMLHCNKAMPASG